MTFHIPMYKPGGAMLFLSSPTFICLVMLHSSSQHSAENPSEADVHTTAAQLATPETQHDTQPEVPSKPRRRVTPATAAALSLLFPGLGHFYLGDRATGLTFSLVGGAELLSLVGIQAQRGAFDDFAASLQNQGAQTSSLGSDPWTLLVGSWYQNTVMYSAFLAYRDARLARNNEGHTLPVDTSTTSDHLLAPFRPSVLLKAEVGLGLAASHLVDGFLKPTTPSLFKRKVSVR
jgi:hypothetical protein